MIWYTGRYFEGKPGYRLPKSHLGLEMELEVVGMAMGHSLLTEGPFLPALHPCIFQYLLGLGDLHYFPQIDDIPETPQTADLISLMENVSINVKAIVDTRKSVCII